MNRETDNSVKGSYSLSVVAASLGRDDYVSQVVPARQQVTVNKKIGMKIQQKKLKIATWNVRTMYQAGKLANVEQEMERMKIDVLGVSEVRWREVGRIRREKTTFIYSGGEEHRNGVGILLTNEVAKSVMGYWAISDRVLMVKISGHPFNIVYIQAYAPTSDSTEEEINTFYSNIEKAKRQCKPQDIIILLGDMNAKVGRGREGEVVGPFGLGDRNERGNRFVEWCEENSQVICNTWFRHSNRHLWTWKSPGDRYKNQIDYITINKRFRNAIQDAKTHPGADADTDHVPVYIIMKVKLKKLRIRKTNPKREYKVLQGPDGGAYAMEVRNRYRMLEEEMDFTEVQNQWSGFTRATRETTEDMVPIKRKLAKRDWMKQEILDLMEDRRKVKARDPIMYRELDRTIKQMCTAAKEEWLDEECAEVEELARHHSNKMYDKIKLMTGKNLKHASACIMKADGTIAMEEAEVLERWEEHVGNLYGDENRPIEYIPQVEDEDGLEILRVEVEHALKKMKDGKAVGVDGVAAEELKALGEFGIDILKEMACKIHEMGYITKEMEEIILLTMPKKAGTLECNKHRTISIISHISKLILRIVLNRIRPKIRAEVAVEQCGFVEGKGTTNAIFILRMLIERCIEMQKKVYACFIDYEKAFDTVRHQDLIQMLESIGVDGKEISLLANLYWHQKATVRINGALSNPVSIERGVRQGCPLSPDLFSLYGEFIMREIDGMDGVKVGGININNIRYADDTVLVAESERELQLLVDRVKEASEERGLKINVGKTESVVFTKGEARPRCRIFIGNEEIKQKNSFVYLGSKLTADGRSEEEISRRINEAKRAFQKMGGLLKNRHMSLETRKRALKTYVWSVLLYGCETWTISKTMTKRLEAAEMWMWRRMLRISWTDRVTNEEVLRRMGVGRGLMKHIRERQLRFLGHVMRRGELENVCLTGRVEGTRSRGRPREKYMDGLVRAVGGGVSAAQLLQITSNRDEYQAMVANVLSDMAQR